MEIEYLPLDDAELVILITNSNVRHSLTGSEYPSRRKCCERAAKSFGLSSLRELDLSTLNSSKSKLDAETFKRARHVVTEISRTETAAKALKRRDYVQFGKLMNESHASLR